MSYLFPSLSLVARTAALRLHVVEPTRCERCGCQLDTPGLCAPCAETVYEVDRPTRVSAPWRRNGAILFALAGCMVLICLSASAAGVNLGWDPSPAPGVTNYVLYAHTNALTATNLASAAVRISVGTNLTASVESLLPGRWWFTVTAMKDGLESDPSNILAVEMAKTPANLRTVVLQYSGTLSNFYDVGFFRLRLP